MRSGILPEKQFEDIVAPLPIHRRAALLSHDAILRANAHHAESPTVSASQERQAILAFLRRSAGDGLTVRGKHALKLADQIEAGVHHAS